MPHICESGSAWGKKCPQHKKKKERKRKANENVPIYLKYHYFPLQQMGLETRFHFFCFGEWEEERIESSVKNQLCETELKINKEYKHNNYWSEV